MAQVLRPLTSNFEQSDYPQLLVGLDSPDDCAVYQVNPEQAIISTMDFFPPIVDNPYDFGAIAAANALSDVYAMGGDPIMAINLVAYPDGYGIPLLSEILRGGAEKVKEAGIAIAGGHTVTDKEPKYGLAVTGVAHPKKIITKGRAKPGDKLILTKPLGSGTITTALKQQKAKEEHVADATQVMTRLNRDASLIARKIGVNAMTDITGYGLIGHAYEMSHASQVEFQLSYNALNWIPGALTYAKQDIFPGGMGNNRQYFEKWVTFDTELDEYQENLLFDPQTSGGLLIAIDNHRANDLLDQLFAAGDNASIIGEVASARSGIRFVK